MGKVTLFVTEAELKRFLVGFPFEGRNRRLYDTDFQVEVPASAVKEVKQTYTSHTMIYVYEKEQW